LTAVPEPRESALGDAAAQHTPRLTIGEVLAVLRDDFPDVTISKIRYLEAENLVHPQRTPSGYRKFSAADVSRLRYVLTAQRDHYLPLKVIKEQLDALDRGDPLPAATPVPAAVPPPVGTPAADGDEDTARPLTAEQFARAGLARHGLEPRHLRVYRSGVEREAGLVEQLVAPVLRARSEEARARATEKLHELAALSAQLHQALLESRLRELLGP
jgi:DNA-binding transcriptional MerR regulator